MSKKPKIRGSVVIKNVSEEVYLIEELNDYSLDPDETIDLMNQEVVYSYSDWEAANRLVTNLPTAKLYQDIQSGDISVIVNDKTIAQE